MLNYTAGSHGISNALKASAAKVVFTSRQFLEKGNLTHIPEQVPEASWIYLEDLKDTVTWQDKLWIIKHLFNPKKPFFLVNRLMKPLFYSHLVLKVHQKVLFTAMLA